MVEQSRSVKLEHCQWTFSIRNGRENKSSALKEERKTEQKAKQSQRLLSNFIEVEQVQKEQMTQTVSEFLTCCQQ